MGLLFDERAADPLYPGNVTTEPVVAPTQTVADTGATEPDDGSNTSPGPATIDDTNMDPIGDVTSGTGQTAGSDAAPSTDPTGPDGVPVQDLYPEVPELGEMGDVDVADPTGADVTEADTGVGEVGTPGTAETDTGSIVDDAVSEMQAGVGTGEQTALTAEQQVDAELTRILGADSPLLAQARAQAMQLANQRGLMNTSMAAGMGMDAMTKVALPMAQQNAQQAATRELENTRMRQEAGLFTAEETARLRALEAELGQDLSIFNADQLNQAERLSAELRTALEQGNQQAYNEAALQLSELQRDAEAQQAEIDYASNEREFLERQAYNEQVIDAVTALNEQYMIGEQQNDLAHLNGTYNQIISTNETAATLFDSYLNSIGNVFDNPDMSSAQAAEAIGAMVNMLEASLSMISEMNGMDFGDLGLPGGSVPNPGGPEEPPWQPGGFLD